MTTALHMGLWIAQAGLVVAFLIHGRLTLSLPELRGGGMGYLYAIPRRLRLLIGGVELLAAVGLILPQLTNILPWLSPLAALGLVILMLCAIAFHAQRREFPNLVLNGLLLLVAAFVGYGRWFIVPAG